MFRNDADTLESSCKHVRTGLQTQEHSFIGRSNYKNTIRYDGVYKRAPKSWRVASLICHTEPNKQK